MKHLSGRKGLDRRNSTVVWKDVMEHVILDETDACRCHQINRTLPRGLGHNKTARVMQSWIEEERGRMASLQS